jgi:hypothetical protein
MWRMLPILFVFASLGLVPGCFGDNERGTGLVITAPAELDGGDSTDVTIAVRGKANDQVSVAVDSTAGTFDAPTKVVITDASGDGVFTTRYTAANKSETVTITANMTSTTTGGISSSKEVAVFEISRIGNVAPIANEVEETAYLTAYPFDLPASVNLRKLAIVAPAAATALIGLYGNIVAVDGDAPGAALARTTATLVIGPNEVAVPPVQLAAGRYWMLVTYSGEKVSTARSTAMIVGRTLSPYAFTNGLPDQAPNPMTLTTNMGLRNFYLVVRQ